MRFLVLIFLVVVVGKKSFSQTDYYSIYFELPSVKGKKQLTNLNPTCFGNYQLDENENTLLRSAAGDGLVIDETGMYIGKNKLLSISRTEIRENSKYTIRNGYLFGVVKDDSVRVALEDDRYYFLLPSKTYLYEKNNAGFTLYEGKTKQEYIIFTKEENQMYSVLYVQCTTKTVLLGELDLENDAFDPRTIKDISVVLKNPITYRANPNESEWDKLLNCFTIYDSYSTPD